MVTVNAKGGFKVKLMKWKLPERNLLKEALTPVGSELIFSRCSTHLPSTNDHTLVFIHGLIVSGSYMLPTAELLAKDYRVVVPDLPGYGRSSKPQQCKTIPELASIMTQWMRKRKLGPATVVANSFGCHVAAEMAMQAPELIEGLVLIGPPDGEERRILVQLGRLLSDAFFEHPSLIPLVAHDLCQVEILRAVQTFSYMTDHKLHDALTSAGVRTMLLHGEKDPVAPARWMEKTAKAVTHAKLHMLPRAGHSTNYSNASDTASLIREFIEDVDGIDLRDEAA
jgi:2-hydroxy-6-oxonona-2,4-dienedioate hydrolase